MTEAEKALVDFVLSQHWGRGTPQDEQLNLLCYAIGAERTKPEVKRAWMDAFKAKDRAVRAYNIETGQLDLPAGVNYDEWRAEARRELASE